MWYKRLLVVCVSLAIPGFLAVPASVAQDSGRFVVELEAGSVWQSRNDVQIPNSDGGTRFSLVDVAGNGPVLAGRMYVTWNVTRRHSVRVLLAPLAISETGSIEGPVDFAGASFMSSNPVEATYKFNSWRVGYRYRFRDRERLQLSIGLTAKVRDAKIELKQGSTTSKDTDLGFVPLAHLGAHWQLASRWFLVADLDGLAGGPGRAFDIALKLGYAFDDRWSISAGYRTLEGGADVDSVYNFAWLHYAVISGLYRF